MTDEEFTEFLTKLNDPNVESNKIVGTVIGLLIGHRHMATEIHDLKKRLRALERKA